MNDVYGVTLVSLGQMDNKAGAVLHLIRPDGGVPIGEVYFSEILPGAVKDWRRHHRQTQNLAVPTGRLRLAIFDDRDGSPTRGRVQVLEMGRPDAYFRLRIPPGLWYSFGCIGATAVLLANVTDLPHDPTESEKRPWDDPTFPHRW